MKKLSYLIVLALVLGLVLTGCSLLSNIGQVPTIGQKGMPLSTADLVALWHFDEGSGIIANDSSGNGNTGTLVNGPQWEVGKFGNALSFDGTNDYVGIADSSILDITQGTWEAWIKFDTLPSVAGHPMNPLAKANQHWIHGSLNDTDSGTTDAIVVKIRVGGTRYCAQTSSYFITADVWYHVAGTYDGETLKLYVNGTLVNSNTAPSGDIDTGDQIMAVGTWSTLADYFQGTIDEVRIWDGALTAEQILYSYANEILHVDDDWLQWPGAYTTINEALAVAVDGDTIIVHEGTYTDDIWDSLLGVPAGYRITKSVTLLGAQAGNNPAGSIDRGGETILVRTNGKPYSLYASGITIDGFTFTSGGGSGGGRLIIGEFADDVTIRNCIIKDISGTDPHGVYIYSGADNALVEYNTFYNTAWEAIASTGASNAVITHNHISASGQHAIQWMGHSGSDNEISYNHISGIVGKNAIQYWGGPKVTISHNIIVGGYTMYDGIWLDNAADDSTVSHNQISNTVYAGINIREYCIGVTVTCNNISGCGTGVEKHAGDITGVSINYNNIAGNSWGVRNYDTEILNATCNWWGDNSGPSGVGLGTGDAVSAKVDYNPWLTQGSSLLVNTPEPQPVASVVLEATLSDSTSVGIFGMDVEFYYFDGGNLVGTATTDIDGVAKLELTPYVGEAGVYEVYATICDLDSLTVFLVVYDPSAGFVTGGGWIDSPAGAYAANTSLTGKATFGFVSKYKKGATVPTGNTEFQFKAGDLNFHSDSYDWLVIAGDKAKYKGTGTINGIGDYGFMLTAKDGDPDLFRIKIQDKTTDTVIYDNQMDSEDTEYAGTELGGGQIIVHSGK